MTLVQASVSAAGVAHVTLSRPEKRNAISTELAAEFRTAVETGIAAGISAAILDAEGPVFCAGADLTEPDPGQAVSEMLDVLLAYPVHWTVVVRRPVLGAGLALLSACPLVLAAPGATFALPELARGFFPAALMSGQVAVVGLRAAYDLAFSAAPISAARAFEIGLISRVCDEAEIAAVAEQRTSAIVSSPHDAVIAGVALWQEQVRHRVL